MGGQCSAGTGGFGSQLGSLHRTSDFCGASSWPCASPKGIGNYIQSYTIVTREGLENISDFIEGHDNVRVVTVYM